MRTDEAVVSSREFVCTDATRHALNRAWCWYVMTSPWALLVLAPLLALYLAMLIPNLDEPGAALGITAMTLVGLALFAAAFYVGGARPSSAAVSAPLRRFDYATAGTPACAWHRRASSEVHFPTLRTHFRHGDVTRVVVHRGGVVLRVGKRQRIALPRQLFDEELLARLRRR